MKKLLAIALLILVSCGYDGYLSYWEKQTAESVTVIEETSADDESWKQVADCLGVDIDSYKKPDIKITQDPTMKCMNKTRNACSHFYKGRTPVIYISQYYLQSMNHEFVHIFINCGDRCHGQHEFIECGSI